MFVFVFLFFYPCLPGIAVWFCWRAHSKIHSFIFLQQTETTEEKAEETPTEKKEDAADKKEEEEKPASEEKKSKTEEEKKDEKDEKSKEEKSDEKNDKPGEASKEGGDEAKVSICVVCVGEGV